MPCTGNLVSNTLIMSPKTVAKLEEFPFVTSLAIRRTIQIQLKESHRLLYLGQSQCIAWDIFFMSPNKVINKFVYLLTLYYIDMSILQSWYIFSSPSRQFMKMKCEWIKINATKRNFRLLAVSSLIESITPNTERQMNARIYTIYGFFFCVIFMIDWPPVWMDNIALLRAFFLFIIGAGTWTDAWRCHNLPHIQTVFFFSLSLCLSHISISFCGIKWHVRNGCTLQQQQWKQ